MHYLYRYVGCGLAFYLSYEHVEYCKGEQRRSKHKSRLNTAKRSENPYKVITGTYETSNS